MSATDDARAQSGYTVQQTAAHFARRVQRVSDRIRSTDYQRSVSDIVALDNVQGFLDRIARDDLDAYADRAAARAEATTATIEDAYPVIRRAVVGTSDGTNLDTIEAVYRALADAGLLATDRTGPTETEWGVRHPSGLLVDYGTETGARDGAQALRALGVEATPVRREVTAWTEADR